jgi:hypothetical protein
MRSGITDKRDGIMGLFRKTRRGVQESRTPTWRERRAAQRTDRAEAALLETEQRIHQIADEIRSDLKNSAS